MKTSRLSKISRNLGISLLSIMLAVGIVAAIGAKSHGPHGLSGLADSSIPNGHDGLGALMLAGPMAGTVLGNKRGMIFFDKEGGAGGGDNGEAKQALDKLKGHIGVLRGKANEWLSGLKPLEQHEGAERLGYVFSRLGSAHQDLSDMLDRFSEYIPRYEDAMQSMREAAMQELKKDATFLGTVKEQILQSGEYVKKTDADGRVQAAEQSARDSARQDFEKETKQRELLGTRRSEAMNMVMGLIRGPSEADRRKTANDLCSKLSDESLLADNYKANIEGTVTRIKKATELGITKTEILQEVCSMAPEAFDTQIKAWTEIANQTGGGRRVNPFAGGQQRERQSGGGGGGERKRVFC